MHYYNIIIWCGLIFTIFILLLRFLRTSDEFRDFSITTSLTLIPKKEITLQKITNVTIKGITVNTSLDQPNEVLVIYLKINKGVGIQPYLNQIYEDADYSIISGNITFVNKAGGYTFLNNKILDEIKSESRYSGIELIMSKYKTGFPQTPHEPVDYTINIDIAHAVFMFDILDRHKY